MFIVIFLSILLTNVPCAFGENYINVTGGGVVEEGQDLVLTYHMNSDNVDMEKCKWGKYGFEHKFEDKLEHCTFQICCSDECTLYFELYSKMLCQLPKPGDTNKIEHIGTTKSEIQFKIANTTTDISGVWWLKLNTDVSSLQINVTLQST